MLFAYGYWGFQVGENTFLKIALGIGIPVLAAMTWGIFMAPHSSTRLKGVAHLAVKLSLFGLAAVALISAGETKPGLVFGVISYLNTILLAAWQQ